ncbi:MAG: MFS transporter [Marmoricola sp.]
MTSPSVSSTEAGPAPLSRLWHRSLDRYPGPAVRYTSLGIVVLATIVLYYQFYLAGAVATHILAAYHMSFVYYVNISVIGYAFGAVASFATGVADRYGRANIVTVGLFVVALLCLVGIPAANSGFAFGVIFILIGLVEGVILVATPALIRDFSPQLGRASAMGFWTLGPVLGSLVVSVQVSNTSDTYPWQNDYVIAGIVGLVVAALALLLLRELSPALRDQVMVSANDRALIEVRAQGVDVEASLKHPFRQMLKPDIVLSAFAISVFLIVYYLAVGFFPIYFQTIFGFSQSQANALGNWMWAFNAGGLLVIGLISDRVGVRKPFMLVGSIAAIVFTIIFLSRTDNPDTGYGTFVWILILLAVSLGVAYAPWMASFTETAEKRNPALAATGLAIWGLVIRIVIALTVFFLPYVVDTVTPLVEKGPVVQQIAAGKDPSLNPAENATVAAVAKNPAIVPKVKRLAARYAPDLKTAAVIKPATEAKLQADPTNRQAAAQAVGQIAAGLGIGPRAAQARLVALGQVPRADLVFLAKYGKPLQDPKVQKALKYLQANAPQVEKAAADSPGQWRTYWWVAVGGEVVFIPLIWMLTGYWDPRRARREAAEHEAWVREQLAREGSPDS